jgi:hypothetical protein
MRNLAAAIALALLSACAASYSDGSNPINGPDSGSTGGPLDAGDGGSDGGLDSGVDGGQDAGPDAGCVPLSFNSAGIVDSCAGMNGTATGSVEDAGHNCAVNLTLTTTTSSCFGTASGGSANAFTGYCNAMPCVSASLPGTLSCNAGAANCTIQISCDAGTCP